MRKSRSALLIACTLVVACDSTRHAFDVTGDASNTTSGYTTTTGSSSTSRVGAGTALIMLTGTPASNSFAGSVGSEAQSDAGGVPIGMTLAPESSANANASASSTGVPSGTEEGRYDQGRWNQVRFVP
jgi:hypothetical protein